MVTIPQKLKGEFYMKRSLALILSLVLIFSCIGIPAIAAEASPISNMTALFTKPEGNFYGTSDLIRTTAHAREMVK